jgi:glycogen(starch) synthase
MQPLNLVRDQAKMRVLLWSEAFWPHIGGVQVLAARLLPALQERGYDFTVITAQDDSGDLKSSSYKGTRIYRYPFRKALARDQFELFMTIKQEIATLKRNFAPDVIHIYAFGPSALFHLNTQNSHLAPLLVTLHEQWPDPAFGSDNLLPRVLKCASRVTFVSANLLAHTNERLTEPLACASIIYNGLDGSSYRPGPLPLYRPRLLCLGRLVPGKRIDLALRALASIRGCYPNVRMIIAGDGPSRSELENIAAELGVADVVDFIGWIPPDDVPAVINFATAVLMPSRNEGLPLVALETALMARPLIAARVGGLPELIEDGDTGLLVDSEDPQALVKAIQFVLDHPRAAKAMGEAARKRALKLFAWERCVDAYDALYRKLASTQSPAL